MRVLVLGAAGEAGRAAVACLAGLQGIERIFIADRNAEALNKLAVDLGGLPISPRYLDAEGVRGLRERMAEADLALGCLGPFHACEGRIVEAAVASRRDYISLCDDPAAVEEALSLHSDAERAGVRVLSGCGLTPGISNLLACRAASRLDRVEAVEMAWYLEVGNDLGTATLEHLLHAMGGRVDVLRGGRARKARAGSWGEMVEFPPPAGWQEVSFMGHPEPATLPDTLVGVPEIRFKGGVGGRAGNAAMQSLAWIGGWDKGELLTMALGAAARMMARRSQASRRTALRVTARGALRGVGEEVTLAVCGDYYRLSGMAMAAAAAHLVEAGWPAGAYPPERVLDDRGYFRRLYRSGLRVLAGEGGDAPGKAGSGAITA